MAMLSALPSWAFRRAAAGGAVAGAAGYLLCKAKFCKHPEESLAVKRAIGAVGDALESAAAKVTGNSIDKPKYGYELDEEGNSKFKGVKTLTMAVRFRICEANCKMDALLMAAAGAAVGGGAAAATGACVLDEWTIGAFLAGLSHASTLDENASAGDPSAKPPSPRRHQRRYRARFCEFLGFDADLPL
eukprot:CAMPEP_0117605488 /NCGR_PEP_ID=MMETSP0784-20121206/79220_1 /TAXON_ID=39447 /ORGANISM="" /LENGTH=187 /DNA_ID=CAMNT_0005408535 /DNA_START=71 /DNA_END=634 /DNA_ORIENTATION=+